MFLDTITALQSANDYGRNALEVLDQEIGWHRLLRMKPELESMVEVSEASPLTVAAEQYVTVTKYAGVFLRTFTFRSARRHDPLLAAIDLLKRLYAAKRRTLPERVPVTHLSQTDRRLIFGKDTHLRSARRHVPDHLLKHVSPLSWEHINLTGIYSWDTEHPMPEGFRSLRLPTPIRRAA